jgi:hypothetical protein
LLDLRKAVDVLSKLIEPEVVEALKASPERELAAA